MIHRLVILLTFLVANLGAAEESPAYDTPRVLCNLVNGLVFESSGIAASRRNPGILWTHNDSGDMARLYAFDATGADRGTLTVSGATHRDWEDLAAITLKGQHLLVIGDIGDNLCRRDDCTICVCVEPELPASLTTMAPLHTLRFTFEDGPRDCEALAVDPTDGVIWLIDKVGNGTSCGVYILRTPLSGAAEAATYTAARVLELALPTVTALDIAPDGQRLVVGTYRNAFEYRRTPGQSWLEVLAQPPREIILPMAKQREAICYDAAGTALVLTSETGRQDRPCPVLIVPPIPAPTPPPP